MPRNGAGVYSKPANTTAVPNTPIESSKYNATIDDLVTDANTARPVVAGGTGASTVSAAQTALSVDNKVVYAAKSGNYTALADDNNAVHRYTATATASLTAAASLGANWHYSVIADGGDVTIDPNASETINGATTLFLKDGQAATIICNGTAFFAVIVNRLAQATKGHINGLTLTTNGSDAANDIDIAAGEAASDGAVPYLMTLASAITKRLDASWSVGTNQGGLDTGAVGNNVYFVWLIQRSDTGVVDALFSLSNSSPTMPANYDRKRLIGQVIRASATNGTPWSAGNYANSPTGAVIDEKFSNYTQNVSILSAIPLDDSKPQDNEGVQLMSVVIAPKSATSKLRARAIITGSTVTANAWCAALFSSASASALEAKYAVSFSGNVISIVALEYEWTPGVTTAVTVFVNTGPATGATMWTNGNSGGRVFGGAMNCTLVVEEIKV